MVRVVYEGPLVPFVRVCRERATERAIRYMACKEAVSWAIRQQAGPVDAVSRAGRWSVRLLVERRRADGDADNLLKLWLDAGQGILWNNDVQVEAGQFEVRRGRVRDYALLEAEVI